MSLALFAPVAQWLEQLTHNQLVVGSSPTRRTTNTTFQMDQTPRPHPYVYAGLHTSSQSTIRYKRSFNRGELNILLQVVCETSDVTSDELISKLRTRHLSDVRKIFFKIGRELFNFQFRVLGEYLGERDHSTVVYSNARAGELIEIDKDFRTLYYRCLYQTAKKLTSNGYELKTSGTLYPDGAPEERLVCDAQAASISYS